MNPNLAWLENRSAAQSVLASEREAIKFGRLYFSPKPTLTAYAKNLARTFLPFFIFPLSSFQSGPQFKLVSMFVNILQGVRKSMVPILESANSGL